MKLGSVGGIFICHNELNKSFNSKKSDSVVVSLDSASREINNPWYAYLVCDVGVIRGRQVETLSEQGLRSNADISNIERCCFERNEIGLPALALRHTINGKSISRPSLSRLFNALDLSLKNNYISVVTADELEKLETNSNLVVTGFGAFFRQADIDEYMANDPMICMKTQLNNENEDELYMDPDEEHLMIVPGFDGLYQNMTKLVDDLLR